MEFIGKIVNIGEVLEYKRTSKPLIKKRVIQIESEDGQKGFFEVRNMGLILFDKEGIEVGMDVTVEFVIQGSESSSGNSYNNLLITNIIRNA